MSRCTRLVSRWPSALRSTPAGFPGTSPVGGFHLAKAASRLARRAGSSVTKSYSNSPKPGLPGQGLVCHVANGGVGVVEQLGEQRRLPSAAAGFKRRLPAHVPRGECALAGVALEQPKHRGGGRAVFPPARSAWLGRCAWPTVRRSSRASCRGGTNYRRSAARSRGWWRRRASRWCGREWP